MSTDQNGNRLSKDVRREPDGTWGVTVWFGTPATNVRRYYYRTREQARQGDISDGPGQNGCIRIR